MEEKEDLEIFSKFLDLVKLHRTRKAKLKNEEKKYNQPSSLELENEDSKSNLQRSYYPLPYTKSVNSKNSESEENDHKHEIIDESHSNSVSPENVFMLAVPTQPSTREELRKKELEQNEIYQKQLERREQVRREYLKHQLEKIKLKKQQLEQKTLEKLRNRIGKKIKVRRWAANPINLDRLQNGYHTQVFKSIKAGNEEEFFKHTRMPKSVYVILSKHVHTHLRKPRQRISIDERISLTLLFLAHGENLAQLAEKYKMGRATVRQTVLDTCQIFWKVLSPIYLSEQTAHEYQEIARGFENTWNMPNCVGAIGGKHIPTKVIRKGGASSIVLLAACDSKYMFTAINVESHGCSNNDEEDSPQVTSFGKNLFEGNLPLPADVPLPNTDLPFQHYFIADAAFPLKKHIMRPYDDDHLETKKHIFNYRLNRACRTIENTFGVLSARWRVLLSTLDWLPQNSKIIILACVALHNFIMWHDLDHWYCPETYVDNDSPDSNCTPGCWRKDVEESGKALESIKTIKYESSEDANQIRDSLSDYFSNSFLLNDIETFDANEIQLYVT